MFSFGVFVVFLELVLVVTFLLLGLVFLVLFLLSLFLFVVVFLFVFCCEFIVVCWGSSESISSVIPCTISCTLFVIFSLFVLLLFLNSLPVCLSHNPGAVPHKKYSVYVFWQPVLAFFPVSGIIISVPGVWRSLVARSAGGREVAGSNPVTPIFFFY